MLHLAPFSLPLLASLPSAVAAALAAAAEINAPAAPINGEEGDPIASPDTDSDNDTPDPPSYGDSTPTTTDVILFVGFMVFLAALITGIWIYARRRRAARARARAEAEDQERRWHGLGGGSPPVYVQPAFFPMRPLRKDRREGDKEGHTLGRTLSTSSTATAVSKDDHDDVVRLETPARPAAAHKSSWRGRIGRMGDQS